jgi:hypothetical protein
MSVDAGRTSGRRRLGSYTLTSRKMARPGCKSLVEGNAGKLGEVAEQLSVDGGGTGREVGLLVAAHGEPIIVRATAVVRRRARGR